MATTERLIACYAQVSPGCLHGKPETVEAPDFRMPEDGTYVREIDAICCTPCYAALGAPTREMLTLAILAAKGVRVEEEEVSSDELEPGDLWSSVPTQWAPGIIGNRIAIRAGNVIPGPSDRVYRIRVVKEATR